MFFQYFLEMRLAIILYLLFSGISFGQKRPLREKPPEDSLFFEKKTQDSLIVDGGKKDSITIFKPTINDYQIQNEYAHKSILDTVLTYDKTYIFTQYNNKDNFGKLRFANIGSGFNSLMYENNPKQNLTVLPTNKSYGIMGAKDIRYYDVKTPTTMFVFHNGIKEGAALKTTYAQNIGKRFNFAIEYMGLRSEGFYQNSLSASNNTIFSGHYISPKSNYQVFAHFIHQNINSEENGGIVDDNLFLNGDSSSQNRENMVVNLSNSNSRYSSRRYYFSQQLSLFKSEKFPFKIRHTLFHQGNKYHYNQSATQNYFIGDTSNSDAELITNYPLDAKKYDNNLSNTFALVFDDEKIKFDAGLRYQMKNLGVTQNTDASKITLPNKIKENRIGVVGNAQLRLWEKLALTSFVEYSNGDKWGNYLNTRNQFSVKIFKDYLLKGKVNFQSSAPSFNYLLNGSIYQKYNYYWTDYKHQSILEMGGEVDLKWLNSKVFAQYFRIDNYTYLDENASPKQTSEGLNISQIGGEATFNYKKIHLNTKLLFQKNLTNNDVLPTPDIIGRFNLYYQAKAFKNAAEIQAGIKTTYFSKFKSRTFMPIFNEYILQGNSSNFEIGNRPLVDVYFNLKVKRMFIFLEGQNVWSLTSNNKSYTAPHYPYSDFRLNIGLVWYMIH